MIKFGRGRGPGLAATGRAVARAERLTDQGRHAEALAIYDELLTHGVTDPVADALVRIDRADALVTMDRPEQALAGYDDLLARHDPEAPGPVELYVLVFAAGYERAGLLVGLGQLTEALTGYEWLIDLHTRHRIGQMAETTWAARVWRAGVLARMGQPDQALAAYDEVLTHPRDIPDAPQPEQLIAAGGNKATLLADLGRPQRALATYDELLADHGGPGESWQVAAVRIGRAELLAALARHTEALAGYDELLTHHGAVITAPPGLAGRAQPERRQVVVEGMLALGALLEQLERWDESLSIYDKITASYTAAPADWSRELAATALRRASGLLERIGRHTDALSACDRAEQLLLRD